MSRLSNLLMLNFMLFTTVFALSNKSSNSSMMRSLQKVSLSEWVAQCKTVHPQKKALQPLCTAETLLASLQLYCAQQTTRFSHLASKQWVGEHVVSPQAFQPFTQKLIVPVNSNIYIWGDLHGDIQALVRTLEKLNTDGILDDHFKIKEPQTYLLFLGDYTDRGQHGTEVIYTILRLALANPEQVILIRGNHEDSDINLRYGFTRELQNKFGTAEPLLLETIEAFYNQLPVVLFLGTQDSQGGCNYLQCCHGGMEMGYDPYNLFALPYNCAYERILELPRKQILHKLNNYCKLSQQKLFKDIYTPALYINDINKEEIEPINIGFMWSDFSATGNSEYSWFNIQMGRFSYGQNLTETLLRFYNKQGAHTVCGLIRAHQHNPTMPGLFENKENKGLYKLPWETVIFTTVATQQYAPGLCTFCRLQQQPNSQTGQ